MSSFFGGSIIPQVQQAVQQYESQQGTQPQQAPQGQFTPQTSAYPTLPNAYGLGQQSLQQPVEPAPQAAQTEQGQQQMMPIGQSAGANPWDIGAGQSGQR